MSTQDRNETGLRARTGSKEECDIGNLVAFVSSQARWLLRLRARKKVYDLPLHAPGKCEGEGGGISVISQRL